LQRVVDHGNHLRKNYRLLLSFITGLSLKVWTVFNHFVGGGVGYLAICLAVHDSTGNQASRKTAAFTTY